MKDIQKKILYPHAAKDDYGRLRVAAAMVLALTALIAAQPLLKRASMLWWPIPPMVTLKWWLRLWHVLAIHLARKCNWFRLRCLTAEQRNMNQLHFLAKCIANTCHSLNHHLRVTMGGIGHQSIDALFNKGCAAIKAVRANTNGGGNTQATIIILAA